MGFKAIVAGSVSVSALALAGCNLFGDSPSGSSGGSSAGRIQLVPTVHRGAPLARVGASGRTGLESFHVAVSHILLAKHLETSGSGWSGLTGPLPLYSNNGMGDFNAIDSNQVRDPAWKSNFIDFCDQASLERIASSQPFTLKDTGDYHWAVINWAPFFKVRATIPLPGDDTLYTHDGYVDRRLFDNNPSNAYYVTQAGKSLLQGPSEEAFVRKNNGGTWFRFLKPLRLTEADLDSTSTIPDTVGVDSAGKPIVNQIPSGRWNVLLVFNPENLVFGGEGDNSNSSVVPSITSPDSGSYIHVPFLKATAVPYREGEAVTRETYEFSVKVNEAWAKGTYGMRLELYLIGDNVVAVSVHSYPTDGEFAPPEVPVIFFADEKDDGSLSLQDYDKSPVFDGFARKQAVGEEGTVDWEPSSHGQKAQVLNYRLTEIKRMN